MKKFPSSILTFIVLLSPQIASASFKDVNDKTLYKPAIDWVQQEGVMTGYGDGTGNFGPDNCLTRAELTKIVQEYRFTDFDERVRLLQQPKLFPDVQEVDWFFDYVNYARHLEIIDGYPKGDFKPNQCTSRVEAVKIIVNSLLPGEASQSDEIHIVQDGKVFNDVWANEWYGPHIKLLLENMLIGLEHLISSGIDSSGLEIVSFYPANNMTRKEVAEILFRIHSFLKPEMTYLIKDEWKDDGLKQSLIKVDQTGKEEVLIENMFEKYKKYFSIIRNNTKTDDRPIIVSIIPEADDPYGNIYTLKKTTNELMALNINDISYHNHLTLFSPNSDIFLWSPIELVKNENEYSGNACRKIYVGYTSLYGNDLDQYFLAIELNPEETLDSAPTYGKPGGLHMEWINNETIKYAVYKDLKSESSNEFIEYRKININEPKVGSYFSSVAQKELPYFYQEPLMGKNSGIEGVFIYMHGAGGGYEQGMSDTNFNGNFKKLKDYLRENGYHYVTAETSSFGEEGGAELAELLEHLDLKFGDISQYVIGASAGGRTVYHALEKVNPYLHVDGAVFIVPTLSEDMINNINFIPPAESDIDFWIEAGELDTALPPGRAELFKQKLEEIGHEVMLNIIPGGGHNTPVEEINWPTVIEFITKPG